VSTGSSAKKRNMSVVSDTCNGLNNLPISSVASSSTLLGVSDEDVETVAGRRGPRILGFLCVGARLVHAEEQRVVL
jgi:hypothetical protein